MKGKGKPPYYLPRLSLQTVREMTGMYKSYKSATFRVGSQIGRTHADQRRSSSGDHC